ncbi:MAG: hypothetical protein KME65_13430 [Candidatus Thiodiazotropha sp. (ex Ctena orbiculata)]|uniref:Uncharacterized protein n=1 Tax=Candidatus Thiodiazotropha taylori TaxID=2792791 RepID=A0A944MA95_9GAMM|nr:hypothetical protein [Candidatus Thiodiazotropha taylori]
MNDAIRQTAQAIDDEFRSLEFARQAFPMLIDWGVEDFSITVHSLGCNYLSALGRELGFWAISEYPVRVPREGAAHSVRPDVAWWARKSGELALLGEFERFVPRMPGKLAEKARNLLQAHHTLGEQPRILLLVGWALAGTDIGSLDEVRAVVHNGFRPPDAPAVPALGQDSVFILAIAVFGDVKNKRRLLRMQL